MKTLKSHKLLSLLTLSLVPTTMLALGTGCDAATSAPPEAPSSELLDVIASMPDATLSVAGPILVENAWIDYNVGGQAGQQPITGTAVLEFALVDGTLRMTQFDATLDNLDLTVAGFDPTFSNHIAVANGMLTLAEADQSGQPVEAAIVEVTQVGTSYQAAASPVIEGSADVALNGQAPQAISQIAALPEPVVAHFELRADAVAATMAYQYALPVPLGTATLHISYDALVPLPAL